MVRVTTTGTQSLASLGRALRVSLVVAVLITGLWDAGASFLNRLTAQDAVRAAGRAAVQVTDGQRVLNDATVARAFVEADLIATDRGGSIVPDGPDAFRVAPDMSVTLTMTRTAPTLIFQHIGPLTRFAQARESWTAHPVN